MDLQNVPSMGETVKYGFLVRCRAIAGKEAELEQVMKNAVAKVGQEVGTITWIAFRFGQSEFGVMDSFYDEAAREVHWEAGSKALDQLGHLVVEGTMSIEKLDIVAAKV